MQVLPRSRGLNSRARTSGHEIEPKPPNLQKGGFLFKIPQVDFRKINITIDNHK
jgi:hypothetical protein